MGRRAKQVVSIADELLIWKVAVYIRLSKEDERKKDESVSVANQKKKIDSYIESSTENFIVVDYYIDDGKTGTNENRNGFQRMLRDIEDGKVNCIIVKDLSRAFRNYVDQGYFLENYFVQYKFRFISLELPMIDSFLFPETITSIAVPIQGVMNDNHAKETSIKVRSVFKTKREKGEFIGSFSPYGYKKSEEDHNKLIIDEPAAKVVRDIYNWYLSGKSKKAIVLELNERGIPNPATYKRKNGMKYENPSWSLAYSELWVFRTVDNILKDEKYIGNMVQG